MNWITLVTVICSLNNPMLCGESATTRPDSTLEECESYINKHLKHVLPYSGRTLKSYQCRVATPADMAAVQNTLCHQKLAKCEEG